MDGGGRTAPTLESVARAAGVSRATASRVLTGSPRVSVEARERVVQAVADLAYVPNGAAQMLVTRRSNAVAFVVLEREDKFFSDPFFSAVLKGAHRGLAGSGKQLLFVVVASDADREQLQRFAAGGHLDAAMFLSLHGEETVPARLDAMGLPVVLAGRPPAGVGDCLRYVDSDNTAGGRTAAQHLLDRGSRRPVTITGPEDMVVSHDRLAGFRQALASSGVTAGPEQVEVGDFTMDGGHAAMARLLDRAPDLDGVFAANDLMAVGALKLLHDRGVAVPGDVAVVGYDDIPLAAAAQPALTTVRQPLEEMGREMAQVLLDALDGADDPGPRAGGAHRPPLTIELVARDST